MLIFFIITVFNYYVKKKIIIFLNKVKIIKMNSNEYSDVYLDNIKSDFFVIKPNETINALMQFEEALGMPL